RSRNAEECREGHDHPRRPRHSATLLTVSRQDVVAAVAHALVECALECLVRLHAAVRATADPAGGRAARAPPPPPPPGARPHRAPSPPPPPPPRRAPDGRAGRGAEQAAKECALASLG